MKLVSIERTTSPTDHRSLRITSKIVFNSGQLLEVWFEVPEYLADQVSTTSNPWILCMLPYALETGEPIYTDIAADPVLVENLKGLQATWHHWYPKLKPVEIRAPLSTKLPPAPARTAAFFSGGIDSWFTVLRHSPTLSPSAIGVVDDLLYVHGFDIPLANSREFEKMRMVLERSAEKIKKPLFVLRTNLRRPGSLWTHGWGWLTHGAGLAASAAILEGRFKKMLIGSAHSYEKLAPWGSHPLTDTLLSSSHLEMVHDGAMYSRVEKTQRIVSELESLSDLHVCWVHGSASNCGKCPKCLRTMVTLSLLGVSDDAMPFDAALDLARLRTVYLSDQNDTDFMDEVRDAARSRGRADVAKAIQSANVRSALMRPWVRVLDLLAPLPRRLHKVPFMWRWQAPISTLLGSLDPRRVHR